MPFGHVPTPINLPSIRYPSTGFLRGAGTARSKARPLTLPVDLFGCRRRRRLGECPHELADRLLLPEVADREEIA